MANPIICVKNLCKNYVVGQTEIHALDDINMELYPGQFLSIMGKSGSGKTTFLNMLGGLDVPTSGSVYIDNQDIVRMPESRLSVFRRKNIGIVFQFFNLIPELNLRENIIMPALLDRKSIDESYFNELCETLAISDRLMHLPGQLSGGQQQRAAIARALMMKPKVVLFDEPTGNLDEISSQSVLQLIRQLADQFNQTIVLVTHDQDAAAISDFSVLFRDGKIV
ncbi:MAG: ABC transporter ATP-binding protein [Clostridiaceae bacterium]|nr:ABC transporter ATP-binding protein [Clostridiaceae bacterium]